MSEDVEQKRLASKLDRAGFVWCHVPNGEKRDKRTAAKLKAMGVKPGVPDVLIFDEPRTAIELKRPDGKGRLSGAQKRWRDALTACGWGWYCCNSEREALDVIRKVYGCEIESLTLPSSARVKRRS